MTNKHETDLKLAIELSRVRDGFGGPNDILDTIAKLNRYSRILHRLSEEDCNRGLTPWQEKMRIATEKRAGALCGAWGIRYELKRDPRAGCGLVLYFGDDRPGLFGGGLYLANARGN